MTGPEKRASKDQRAGNRNVEAGIAIQRDEEMATTDMSQVLQHLRKTLLRQDAAGMTDGQLLGCLIEHRDEAAFAALVRLHGPMVWGVCRRILPHHDAEDAFQATFLVLVRKAASIRPRAMVGNWLYGVAHQTALKARATTAKRRTREKQMTPMPDPAVAEQELWHDMQSLVDQELARLPDKYRVAIVLCDLEGKTRKDAAWQLGCPEGTLAARLARGRAMLAKRLARHGLTVTSGAMAGVLAQNAASASVPTSVVSSTISAASLLVAGQTATGVISPKVAALIDGILKAMLMTKLKVAVAVVLVLGFIVGGTILTYRTTAAQSDRPPAASRLTAEEKQNKPKEGQLQEVLVQLPKQIEAVPMEGKTEKEGFTAWGKEIGGLRAGLGYLPGQHRTYHIGATVTLVVRVRNVGKQAVKFQYIRQFFIETPPVVTYPQGEPVRPPASDAGGLAHVPEEVNLAPGKEIELYELKLRLRPESDATRTRLPNPDGLPSLFGTGKFQIQYHRVFGNSSAGQIKLDPILSKLATGKLELEIKSTPPPDASEFPVGWGGGGDKDYQLRVDKTVRHGGKASGSIKSITTTPLWYGALTQAFNAEKFRGQRFRMTAYVKSKDVENHAGLWIRIEGFDGKGNYSISSDFMGNRPIKGTNDWKQYEVVLDVPKEGDAQISFGVLLAGKGQVWVDDFKFEAVGNAVKTTGRVGERRKAAAELTKGLPKEPRNLDFEQ